jgi:WhiB family redox-sensing transcriptional regulator
MRAKTYGTRELVLPDFDLSQAVCGQADPEVFFPDKNSQWAHLAKKLCQQCNVREECLEWALKNDEQFGVWGGLTASERDALKGRRRAYRGLSKAKRQELLGIPND